MTIEATASVALGPVPLRCPGAARAGAARPDTAREISRHRRCRADGPCRSRWVEHWEPEDEAFWAETGSSVARRNLIWSIVTEHVGFSIWAMWSALVLFLGPQYGLTPAQKFTLTSVPVAVGSLLRLPYTLAVVRFGGRNWTVFSAGIMLVPSLATAALLKPGVEYSTLLMLAALTGIGGASFASSTANINVFYPQRLKGRALAVNAAAGNLGVAFVQLVGLVVLATAGAARPRLVVGIYIPLIVLATAAAALRMDNLGPVTGDKGRDPGGRAPAARLGDLVAVHRDVRVLRRLRFRLRPGAAGAVP